VPHFLSATRRTFSPAFTVREVTDDLADRIEIANPNAPLTDETIRALAAFLLAIVDQDESEGFTDNGNGVVAESQAESLTKPDREASRDTCDGRSSSTGTGKNTKPTASPKNRKHDTHTAASSLRHLTLPWQHSRNAGYTS
jgi:hypothetical protein